MSDAGSERAAPSLRAGGAWLVFAAVAVALDGAVGGAVAVAVAAILLAGLPRTVLGGAGVAALAAVPVAVLANGLPADDEVSPEFVVGSLWPHHLMFVGLVLVGTWAVLDTAARRHADREAGREAGGPPTSARRQASSPAGRVGRPRHGRRRRGGGERERCWPHDRTGGGGLRSSKVLHGSAWILVGIALHSVLGFAFWFLGSKVASSSSVGRAAALYTAIQFVNYASGLGLTVALARFAVDGSDEADALLGWGILATIASSFVFGSAYLVVADTPATRLVSGSAGSWMLFCVYTAGTSVLLVADVRLMAAGRWGWMVSRIAVAGVVRLALLPLDVGLTDDRWLYHLMLAPMAVVGFLTVPLLPLMRAGRAS
ncbi:MAG: hypothetical protein R2701_09930 [Acidimicrobiales bacterium]